MEAKDMIHGEIYYVLHQGTNPWLIKFNKIEKDYITTYSSLCVLRDSSSPHHFFIYPNGNGKWGEVDGNSIRLATPFEERWLEACIEQGKAVPKKQIKIEKIWLIYN